MLFVHSVAEACLFGPSLAVILTRCRRSFSEEQADIHDKLVLTSASGHSQSRTTCELRSKLMKKTPDILNKTLKESSCLTFKVIPQLSAIT